MEEVIPGDPKRIITSGLPTIHELAQLVLTRRTSALSHDELCPRIPATRRSRLLTNLPRPSDLGTDQASGFQAVRFVELDHIQSSPTILVLLTVLLVVHPH